MTTVPNASRVVAQRIRAEAKRQKLSQTQLGDKLGLTQAGVSRRFVGKADISVTEAAQFADVLGVSVSWLFGESDSPQSSQLQETA